MLISRKTLVWVVSQLKLCSQLFSCNVIFVWKNEWCNRQTKVSQASVFSGCLLENEQSQAITSYKQLFVASEKCKAFK